ncbi:MAG: putative Ig domain-containing protein [Candidatus Thalassarchaeaceae archaeon]
MQPIAGQTSGSTPESWGVSPDLPDGLLFGDENGTIWGTPANVQNQTNYTIWANASGAQTSSVVITIIVLVDTDGDSIADLYDDDDDDDGWNDTAELDCGTEPLNSTSTPADTDSDGICDTLDDSDDRAIALAYSVNSLDLVVNLSVVDLSPITSGGTISSWETGSDLPSGINLDNGTGVISGTPTEAFNATTYVIWANNSAFSASFSLNISSSLLDTDGDGIPDETDMDDDNDGWDDANETSCATDPLEVNDYPVDEDGDGICDANDPVDDSPVLLAYPDPLLNLTTNLSIVQIYPIVFGGDVVSWEVSPDLPPGLSLDNATGALSGTPSTEFAHTNFTFWANNSLHGSEFTVGISSWLLDSDGDGDPDETDPDDDNDGWGDGDESDCLTGTLDPTSFPEDGDADGLCDGLDQVDDSEIFLVYGTTSQLLFVNEPIEPMVGITYGGDVRTWEVWPELPDGLTLNGALSRTTPVNGTISGAPMGEFEMQVFTVWANNSQYHSSVEITLQSVTPDPDEDDFDLIYLDEFLNLTTNLDEVYLEPQIFGGNVSSWSISPSAPDGLDFNETNGLLTGIIAVEMNDTIYTVTGSNSLFLDTFQITITASLLDTDEDGVPDLFDPDDDGDGWNDTLEIECGTDPLYIVESPQDHDGDWLCDPLDDFDDSPIVFFYPNDKLMLTVGEEMEPLHPLIAPNSGGVLLFTVIPDLPKGLVLDNSTGVISGTPEEPFNHMLLEYSHRFTAENSQWDFSYRVDFDVFMPIDDNADEDGDGWPDLVELECNTNPLDPLSVPEDIDLDGLCSHIDEDDDGDNIGDVIDRFPKDPTAWDDTDNDTMPDELTCKYLTDSANCTFELEEDLDDDNDGWPDLNETSCATNPKDNLSVPEDDDGDGVCNLLEEYVPDAVRILWICCFPILLLLLLLLWVINPFAVREEEILGPEPEYTTTELGWQKGTGEYDDPYVLMPVKGIRRGSFARSHEVIQVSNITPRLDCDFTDMSSEENGTRFSMKSKKSNSRGNLEFRLEFSDNGETTETTEYVGLIRLGKATVYFQWAVEVEVHRDTPEEEIAKKRARRIEREARRKASEMEKAAEERVAKAEIDAKKKAAEMQKDLKTKVAEVEKDAQERAAAAEEAVLKAEEARREAERKQAEAESEARRKDSERLEREAREKRLEEEERSRIEAEEAAEEERKAEEEAAELRAMLRKKAEERRAEEEARRIEEEAAKRAAEEEAERIEREAQERAEKLQREAQERAAKVEREAARKAAEFEREAEIKAMEAKEKLRKRAVERKRQMDLEEKENQVARDQAAERFAAMEKELEDRKSKLEELDAETKKKETALLRVAEKSKDIDFGVLGFATADQKDQLQEIKGVGPFIEEKLNALGIYTFAQISRMNSDLEDKINEAIEFFPGRIKRDEWAMQARALVSQADGGEVSRTVERDSTTIAQNDLMEQAREELRKKEQEEEKRMEIERRKEKAAELLSNISSDSSTERKQEDDPGIDFSVIGFGSEDDRDNLQQIDGIGRSVEKKLNGIGIYKISQIASMTDEISEEVNRAIGLGPGRIDRDEWVLQAKRLIR